MKDKQAHLRILDPDIDTSTATGTLLLTMIGAIAAFDREVMLERQREGIAKAKAAGKYRGRVRSATAASNVEEVLGLSAQVQWRVFAGHHDLTGSLIAEALARASVLQTG